MITFQNSNEFLLDEIDARSQTVSTLLIPEDLMASLQFILKNHQNNMSLYLRNILHMYRTLTHSGLIPKPIQIKTEYQEKDLNLQRVGFRPCNSDWVELGELALAFGKSRCWVFVHLLKLDIMGLWYLLVQVGLSSGVPTLPNLELQISWTLHRTKNIFARCYHVKV